MSAKSDSITSVILAGVGGQGVLLAARLLSDVAAAAGRDVKSSEVHGMAQRGGAFWPRSVSGNRFIPP